MISFIDVTNIFFQKTLERNEIEINSKSLFFEFFEGKLRVIVPETIIFQDGFVIYFYK